MPILLFQICNMDYFLLFNIFTKKYNWKLIEIGHICKVCKQRRLFDSYTEHDKFELN